LNASVANSTISNFYTSRSLKNGLMQWNYTWTPSNGNSMDIAYSMFMHRSKQNVAAIQLTITPHASFNMTLTDLLDGRGAVRSETHSTGMLDNSPTIFSSVSPHWLPNITAWIYSTVMTDLSSNLTRFNASSEYYSPSNTSTIGQSWILPLTSGTPVTVTKFVGIASSDGFTDPQTTARNASFDAVSVGYATLFAESEAAWSELLDPDLVDDYTGPDGSLPDDKNVVDMQIISKANAHYLLQNLLPSNLTNLAHWSISVGGLQSDSYAGLIFWDADLFMSPGVSIAHPSYSLQIPNYRAMLQPQAAINAQQNGFSDSAIIFPWTSGRWGNCTGTGPCTDYQYHINNDIFLDNLVYWRITGDDTWFRETGVPMNTAVLQMFSELVKYNSTVGGYSISNLTDPDEYANQVPDGAYTLASIAQDIDYAHQYAQQFSVQLESNLSMIAADPALPFAPSGILTEYLGANNTAVIKQDDVDLISYPLGYSSPNYTEADKLQSLDYYSNKQSPDGPAMTYSLYSISANALSPSGCSAYTYALNGFQPYTRAPWYQFSEQQVDNPNINGGTNPAFPFMTGAGGWHQVGPMGWLGARVTESQLVIQPALPPQIPQVSLRTIIFGGAALKATMNYTHTTLTRVTPPAYLLPANSTGLYANKSMPFAVGFSLETGVNMTISLGQTLTIENRMYFSNVTTPGNLVQCLPISSTTSAYQQGQFPLAAIDGASSTRWQPTTRNASSLTIDMTSVAPQPISGVSFDWGSRPAASARITVYNSTTPDFNVSTTESTVTFSNITISSPYNPETASIIQPYVGNMSFFSLSTPIYSGNYLTLTIQGCQENDTLGATVAEFNLFGANGTSLLGVNGTASVSTGMTGGRNMSVGVSTVSASSTMGAVGGVATAGLTGSKTGSPVAVSTSSGAEKVVGEQVGWAMVVALGVLGVVFAGL